MPNLPPKPAPYPGRYNGYQVGWLIATLALAILAVFANELRQWGFLMNALFGFYLGRIGLTDPKEGDKAK